MSSLDRTALVHKRGEIIDELPENATKVNCLKGLILDVEYWVFEGKIYKKNSKGKYRTLVKQEKRTEYPHYFFRAKEDKRKLTLHANKLNLLTCAEKPPEDAIVVDNTADGEEVEVDVVKQKIDEKTDRRFKQNKDVVNQNIRCSSPSSLNTLIPTDPFSLS
jgi:hypothetical protein